MNRYKFQMGAELPPEMMQQMQGMPTEQGIPMEQGMPIEQGNGEASFAQQLMAIEQEIDKIQKEMKKLEKRDDKLAQNEYKRLEQQLVQLEQQKEMLRQQVEATRQQLEAQEQMQGEEYLDPNAQYEMSPEELEALEGQYQDVPMDEQINPEEMQMMQDGGFVESLKKGFKDRWNDFRKEINQFDDEYIRPYFEYQQQYPSFKSIANKAMQSVMNKFKPTIVVEDETIIPKNVETKLNRIDSMTKEKCGGKMQLAGGLNYYQPRIDTYRNFDKLLKNLEEPTYDNIIDVEDTSNGYTIPSYEEAIENINPNDIIDSDHIDFYPDLYKNSHKFSIDPIVITPNTRRDLISQQRKDRLKNNIQTIKDYFGDRPLSDYAQLAITAAGVLDNRARLNNEIARNMTLTDNPYPRIMNNINEYSEGVKQAINREHAQRSNKLRNDIRRLESFVQPRSVFGRSANLMAMQDAYNENQNKLDADYQAKLATNEADRSKQYNAAFENFADTERANKIYNINKSTNALEKDDKITANKYNLTQTELNRWGQIEQDRRDRNFLETQYLDNLYNNYYVNLLSAGIPNNKAIDIVDKLRQKNTKKSTKKSK